MQGAKWQERWMYTEEEVLNILYELHCNNQSERDEAKEWFNQYKK